MVFYYLYYEPGVKFSSNIFNILKKKHRKTIRISVLFLFQRIYLGYSEKWDYFRHLKAT